MFCFYTNSVETVHAKIMQMLNLRVFQKKSRNNFSLRLRIQQVVYDQLFSDARNDARQIICLEIQQY